MTEQERRNYFAWRATTKSAQQCADELRQVFALLAGVGAEPLVDC